MILIKFYFNQQGNQKPNLDRHFAKHWETGHLKSGQSQAFNFNEYLSIPHFLEKYLSIQRLKVEKPSVSEEGAAIHPTNPPIPAVRDLRAHQPFSPNHDCQLHLSCLTEITCSSLSSKWQSHQKKMCALPERGRYTLYLSLCEISLCGRAWKRPRDPSNEAKPLLTRFNMKMT